MRKYSIVAVVLLAFATVAWYSDMIIHVARNLTVGTSTTTGMITISNLATTTDLLHMDSMAASTADYIECDNSAGSALFAVNYLGDVKAAGHLDMVSKTANPCTGATYAMGSIFANSTSSIMCYCGGSTNGVKGLKSLKIDGSSASCF
jgi:hypothetical protein